MRRALPGPAARKGLTPETLNFLSRPEVRGDVDCHGNSFVAPAPTEAEAENDGGDGQWATAGIFPPHATHMERAGASFVADQRRGAAVGFAEAASNLTAVLNTGALAMHAGCCGCDPGRSAYPVVRHASRQSDAPPQARRLSSADQRRPTTSLA